MFYALLSYAAYVTAWMVCGVALWKGDRALRLTAAAVLFFWTLSPLVSRWGGTGWNAPLAIVDTNAFLVLTWISLRWRTLWSAVLAGLALLQVVMPFVNVMDPHIHRFYWISAYNTLGYVTLLVLAVAIGLTVRARRRADEGAVRP